MVGDWERRGADAPADGARIFTFLKKKQQFLNYPFKIIFKRFPSELTMGRGGCEEARGEGEEGVRR